MLERNPFYYSIAFLRAGSRLGHPNVETYKTQILEETFQPQKATSKKA